MDRPPSRRAAHEAGHVVVGAAVGRRAIRVRIGSRLIDESDPLVKHLGEASIVGGSTLFEIGLLDEINQRGSTNEPLEPRHIEWLRADLVMTVGGFLAEEQLVGDILESSAKGDIVDATKTAALLGFKDDSDDGVARFEVAISIAREILDGLSSQLAALAQTLSSGRREVDQFALDDLLGRLGVVVGSHRALLDRLASEDEAGNPQ